jgi:hypothetical protein
MLNSSYDQAWEILLLSLASKSASAKAQEFKFLNHRPNLLTKKIHGEYQQFCLLTMENINSYRAKNGQNYPITSLNSIAKNTFPKENWVLASHYS